MISYDKLKRISKELITYRGDGFSDVLWDGRDAGNYGGYYLDDTLKMLHRYDPTGIAIGMLLHEMIEATINGAKVELSNVLREPEFLGRIKKILDIKSSLNEEITVPMADLMLRIKNSIQAVSSEIGTPSTREVALCLRDAIYSIHSGLTLRWIQCDKVEMNRQVLLCQPINHYDNIAAFVDALRTHLPYGAHLARIGHGFTAIGIKQEGKIAYLSSLEISTERGCMIEERAHNHLHAEPLDLDTMVERYPEWVPKSSPGYSGMHSAPSRRIAQAHPLNRASLLPRDRLIWLAMVVEMSIQQMASTKPEKVQLVETTRLALPSFANIGGSTLPVVYKPKWTVEALSLEEMFQSLRLSPWEENFLRPGLSGLSEADFLPVTEGDWAIGIEDMKTVENPPDEYGAHNRRKQFVHMIGIPPNWAGTQEEIEKAYRQIFGSNLIRWLMRWGNYQFQKEWESNKDWFIEKLKAALPQAFKSSCVKLEGENFQVWRGIHLFSQSAKHRTYHPRCFFNSKKNVTDVVYFYPNTAAELVEMFGLKSESELPLFLQGWSRSLGWTTTSPFDDSRQWKSDAAPYETRERWYFHPNNEDAPDDFPKIAASVCFNKASIPEEMMQKHNEPATASIRDRAGQGSGIRGCWRA